MSNKCKIHMGKEVLPVSGASVSHTQLEQEETGIAMHRIPHPDSV